MPRDVKALRSILATKVRTYDTEALVILLEEAAKEIAKRQNLFFRPHV